METVVADQLLEDHDRLADLLLGAQVQRGPDRRQGLGAVLGGGRAGVGLEQV